MNLCNTSLMRLSRRQFLGGLLLIACCPGITLAAGGLTVSTSRVLIESGKTAAGIVISNNSTTQFLTKSWIEDRSGNKSDQVMAVPPVAYAPPGKHIRFQIMVLNPEELPTDQESLFYFHSHSVPGNGNPDNALTVAFDMKLKVFYRPEGLDGNMASAIEDLKWSFKNGVLTAVNDSKYHISLVTYGINGDYTELQDCVIKPGTSVDFKTTKKYPQTVNIEWAAMDDFGSAMTASAKIDNE